MFFRCGEAGAWGCLFGSFGSWPQFIMALLPPSN